ncbi:MAG: glycosyltransferase [Candidatus Nitrohelix vancouverensis]|uniref:Glycosyltransferase n=1 Tax=Candidatus Nitrohelix vancouverensis TaxID=2705534 RepID=A0A7T0G4G0_9BACT|nr:MAG: glycosyltransferase [Candidatus Nitrohelix vancouverensis]
MNVSIIIPAYNEAGVLEQTLSRIRRLNPHEIIVIDGGSDDATRSIAEREGAKITSSPSGRALQMNAGAQIAGGEILLFLHADSAVTPEGFQKMIAAMNNDSVLGGAFSLRIDSPKWALRLISKLATLRSRYFHLVYGDQAIFVRKSIFDQMQGFATLPICEDIEFYLRLRKQGRTILLQETALTSARRWNQEGIFYTTARNILIAGLFLMGFSPRILSQWYLSIR